MTYKLRHIRDALMAKGFRTSETDHTAFFLFQSGMKTAVRTMLSHGSPREEIGPPLRAKIQKQLHLSNVEFGRFVECPLTREEYLSLMLDR